MTKSTVSPNEPQAQIDALHQRIVQLEAALQEKDAQLAILKASQSGDHYPPASQYDSQQMLKLILDHTPQAIFWKNTDSVYLGCNKAFAEDADVAGPEGVIGKTDYDFPWKDTQAELYRADDKYVMDYDTAKLNYVEGQTTADGRELWLLTHKVPLHDTNGELIGVLGMYEDFTARKQIEDELRSSEAKFRALTQTANDAIVTLDHQGIVTLWNTGAEKIFGYSAQETLGKPLVDIIVPHDFSVDYKDAFESFVKMDVIDQSVSHTELTARHKDGHQFPVEMSYAIWQTDDEPFFTAIVRDISGRKRIEAELRRSEDRLLMAFDAANIGWFDIHDNVFETQFDVSDQMYALIGYDPGEIEINIVSWGEMLHPDDIAHWRDFAKVPPENRFALRESEYRVCTKQGEWRWVLDRSRYTSFDENGNPTRSTGILMDITQRKESEMQRVELTLERERANLLAEFITGVSHEFRNPLSVINTRQFLLKRVNDAEKSAQYLAEIEVQTEALATLVESMIIMVKLQQGFSPSFVPVDMHQLLTDICARMQSVAEKSGQQISSDLVNRLPMIYGDTSLLKTAITHILDNAIRHGGSEVRVHVVAKEVDNIIHIEISDDGVGMTDAQISHAFELFYRVDEERTTRGFGLGLPIAERIFTMHRGSIELLSIAGQGTTVHIYLPVDPEATVSHPISDTAP